MSNPLHHQFRRQIHILKTVSEVRKFRKLQSDSGKRVGFVPTMGALHQGHLTLCEIAKSNNSQRCQAETVISSIFVNPSQFGPTEDLTKYPRQLEEDLERLKEKGVEAVFVPSVQEIYPSGFDNTRQDYELEGTFVEVKGLSHQLEGSVRPTHFRGVATVVTKLFNICQPDFAVFGQKDVQQCVVIKRMVRDLFIPTDTVIGKTVREPDGLAMSSRNRYLSAEQRRVAPKLYQALKRVEAEYAKVKETQQEVNCQQLKTLFKETLVGDGEPNGISLDYISIADGESLGELNFISKGHSAIMSATIRLGTTRLLDNLILTPKQERNSGLIVDF